MGGYRYTVEDSHTISVFHLNREGAFKLGPLSRNITIRWYDILTGINHAKIGMTLYKGRNGGLIATFDYQVTVIESGDSYRMNYSVDLTSTPCNFGGHRYWFSCPECGRRVATLHMPPWQTRFACRSCHNLTYLSRRDPSVHRMLAAIKKMHG